MSTYSMYSTDSVHTDVPNNAAHIPGAIITPRAELTIIMAETEPEPDEEPATDNTTEQGNTNTEAPPTPGVTPLTQETPANTGVIPSNQTMATPGVTIISEATEESLKETMDQQYGQQKSKHNLRKRKPRQYEHLHANISTAVASVSTPQMSMKKGLTMFGEEGKKAVKIEMEQIHERKVMKPVHKHQLTHQQLERILNYLMLLRH
mmetsp:Transcript_35435/g.50246  ORF Transcript_35435/g.50246 Transcript_35435/m.50246 type:complete len:206 (-) Transcript_35435:87-704(-)